MTDPWKEWHEDGDWQGPTLYRGYNFPTVVEARWAVFFDALGDPWDYDSKAEWGLFNPQSYYRPQFLLPRLTAYLEVRPDDDRTRQPLLHYDPEIEEPIVYLAVDNLPDERQLGAIGWWDSERRRGVMSLVPCSGWEMWFPPDYPDVVRAIEVARTEEFGKGRRR